MAYPGFAGRASGRDTMIAGFVDFCENAKVHDYKAIDREVDVVGEAAVATFKFEMIYEREGVRYRATGRDLWVFSRVIDRWKAVWRTMLDLNEEPVGG